jgi:hypothetical protein
MLLNIVKDMLRVSQTCNFTAGMKTGLALGFILICFNCFPQEKVVTGIIFDKESKEREASVNIDDITKGISVYDNLKGEFRIDAAEGDVLVFSRQQYLSDTIKVQNTAPLAIYLTRLTIRLKEVTVHDSLINPDKRLEATKNDFTKIYGSLGYRDFLSTPSYGGAGLSIDALWNALSRSGRNAARLQEIIQSDYQQNVIDFRFNRTYVAKITGLQNEKLTSFMFRYRPGYYTAKTASEYEFVSMIRNNLRRFLRHPRIYSLPSLNGG